MKAESQVNDTDVRAEIDEVLKTGGSESQVRTASLGILSFQATM